MTVITIIFGTDEGRNPHARQAMFLKFIQSNSPNFVSFATFVTQGCAVNRETESVRQFVICVMTTFCTLAVILIRPRTVIE